MYCIPFGINRISVLVYPFCSLIGFLFSPHGISGTRLIFTRKSVKPEVDPEPFHWFREHHSMGKIPQEDDLLELKAKLKWILLACVPHRLLCPSENHCYHPPPSAKIFQDLLSLYTFITWLCPQTLWVLLHIVSPYTLYQCHIICHPWLATRAAAAAAVCFFFVVTEEQLMEFPDIMVEWKT